MVFEYTKKHLFMTKYYSCILFKKLFLFVISILFYKKDITLIVLSNRGEKIVVIPFFLLHNVFIERKNNTRVFDTQI